MKKTTGILRDRRPVTIKCDAGDDAWSGDSGDSKVTGEEARSSRNENAKVFPGRDRKTRIRNEQFTEALQVEGFEKKVRQSRRRDEDCVL